MFEACSRGVKWEQRAKTHRSKKVSARNTSQVRSHTQQPKGCVRISVERGPREPHLLPPLDGYSPHCTWACPNAHPTPKWMAELFPSCFP